MVIFNYFTNFYYISCSRSCSFILFSLYYLNPSFTFLLFALLRICYYALQLFFSKFFLFCLLYLMWIVIISWKVNFDWSWLIYVRKFINLYNIFRKNYPMKSKKKTYAWGEDVCLIVFRKIKCWIALSLRKGRIGL